VRVPISDLRSVAWRVLCLLLLLGVSGCPTPDTGDDDAVTDDDTTAADDDTAMPDDDASDDDVTGDDDVADDDTALPDDDAGDDDTDPPCPSYESQEEEYAPIQTTGAGLPPGSGAVTWQRPADYEWLGAFSGTPGSPASHEGVDYVHDDAGLAHVPILAAADGVVAYVRLGCPQSSTFQSNQSLRECGAGWGNHVVVDHGSDIVTRYAHLDPSQTVVEVGEPVTRGEQIAEMGNSGRSDVRHLHFELGTIISPLDPCAAAQSFERVYDSEQLSYVP